ncbi:group II intron maturase-specific domain-containing protein [Rhodanobacter sp. AS-Z3]|uniref:group II intron maturase-specific domain-containing protein n=1 Tax=Rhodanobacter sp. AS-Z3 TaxID=3031330 RepID=UPI00247A7D48|nr:group II intron maturase-specific domain-containing protein [Rhodanobacter sp. AS-Z3]WEN16924.1 group II intron maturase-specific domain-containing protein [Rhodanobacter sp. AS-Z3]
MASRAALKRQTRCERESHGTRHDDLSRMFNPVLRGWRNYYERFHGSATDTVWKHLDAYLMRWLQRKYKSLVRHKTRAWEALRQLANVHSRAFVHWKLRYT